MKLRVVALGHRMPAWVAAGLRRLREAPAARMARSSWSSSSPSRAIAASRSTQMLAAEASRLAAACAGYRIVALDERGTPWTTRELADALARWRDDGDDVAFVIGSADGLAADVKASAAAVVALSAMTLPHGLVRVLLAEQLYRAAQPADRAIRIIANDLTIARCHERSPALSRVEEPAPAGAAAAARRRVRDAAVARGDGPRPRRRRGGAATPSPRCTTSSASRARRRRSAGSGCRTASSPPRPVLGADTEVVLDGEVFGKPRDADDAIADAEAALGAHAQVLTAVARPLSRRHRGRRVDVEGHAAPARRRARSSATSRPASRSTRPAPTRCRAAPRRSSRRIEGSYSGVVGLPLCETATLLARIGFPVL